MRHIAVYEYGDDIDLYHLMYLPLSRRLNIALEVVDLMTYLERSPCGSLGLIDLRLRHFLWQDNTLKLFAVGIKSEEPSCDVGHGR